MPSRGASAADKAESAYPRVKSLTQPLPSVLPKIAAMASGATTPSSISRKIADTSPG
jgi:hypothetical protein